MTEPMRISIVLVDDHPVVRDGLRGMLESAGDLAVVGEASDGPAAVELVARADPDVVLMDLRMPGGSGVDAITELTRRRIRGHVLVLTTYDTDRDIMAALEAGATGYLLKDARREELFAGVRATARGESVLSPSVATRVVSRVRADTTELSDREGEVLRLVARGRSNREIARTLFVSEATVKTHLTHVYEKLGVGDRAAAVAVAYERRLLGD
ncbi:response regulator transcription factor [Aeromicrobium sp. YIM 150415]|uniref:response regulator n=1 Tax=Aeromicrobium sp. YIM 150415 TaxID=2803912 RepID=UPI0019639BAD|nr:response regulator transcription factor [Aeromicrobium sp. YIM 150415]MBM9463934.1 response regulator transcription factor [Aeromicrobium sp. YIM 150415]